MPFVHGRRRGAASRRTQRRFSNCLGSLYLGEQRLNEARITYWTTPHLPFSTGPKDVWRRIWLNSSLFGVYCTRGWANGNKPDRTSAMRFRWLDRQPAGDPCVLPVLLVNYSYVLRKNHRRREARPSMRGQRRCLEMARPPM